MRRLKTIRAIAAHPLTRHAKLAAIGRFARWQIVSRLHRGPRVVPFIGDSRLLVSRGMTGATGNIYMGLHEFEEMSFLLHSLRQDELFVDVGANVGTYTVLASKVAQARSIAVEPIERAFESLLDNVHLNRIHHAVEPIRCALGGEPGVIRFIADRDTMNRAAASDDEHQSPNADGVDVPVRTLDEVLGDREPTLIKVDVEGYETQVMKGAMKALARPTLLAIIMETNQAGNRYGFDEAELRKRMERKGFLPCVYEPFERSLSPVSETPSGSRNTILIRSDSLEDVQQRVRSAPAIRVLGRDV